MKLSFLRAPFSLIGILSKTDLIFCCLQIHAATTNVTTPRACASNANLESSAFVAAARRNVTAEHFANNSTGHNTNDNADSNIRPFPAPFWPPPWAAVRVVCAPRICQSMLPACRTGIHDDCRPTDGTMFASKYRLGVMFLSAILLYHTHPHHHRPLLLVPVFVIPSWWTPTHHHQSYRNSRSRSM